MSLNIKNENVHAAVRELARRLGISQTAAVEVAVHAKLSAIDAETSGAARPRRIRTAVAAAQQAFASSDTNLHDTEADLYDTESGLPR